MTRSNYQKIYYKFLNQVFAFLLLFSCFSCFDINCGKIAEYLRSKECNIVVREPSDSGRWFEIKGYHPISKEDTSYSDMESWYVQFNEEIEVGDTVVKKNGELNFYIHKKDTLLKFPFKCEGKVFE